jgi:hypothetical protein
MSAVYDGHVASERTKDEVILDILREYEVVFEQNTLQAMNEAFREGWLRGEEYGRDDVIADYNSGRRRVKTEDDYEDEEDDDDDY